MKVTMINSVGELPAGTEQELDDDTGNRFIILGYASGELSREFSDEERVKLSALHQSVSVG